MLFIKQLHLHLMQCKKKVHKYDQTHRGVISQGSDNGRLSSGKTTSLYQVESQLGLETVAGSTWTHLMCQLSALNTLNYDPFHHHMQVSHDHITTAKSSTLLGFD